MRSDRPSMTSMAVAAMRAIYAELPPPLGAGPDPLAKAILPKPFLIPARMTALAKGSPRGASIAHRAFGAVSFGITYNVALRTRALDEALRESVKAGTKQIVVLGAGLDGRAFRMSELERVKVYEVDHPSTQRDKKARLAKANIEPIADIEFVPVDFERDELDASLIDAGFSASKPSFWIWEGVTMYLSLDAVSSTLRAIARVSAPGSRVAMTYARPVPDNIDPSRKAVAALARAIAVAGGTVIGAMGETIRGFIDLPTLMKLAEDAGFVIRSDEDASDWAKRYWLGKSPGPFRWERIAILERLS